MRIVIILLIYFLPNYYIIHRVYNILPHSTFKYFIIGVLVFFTLAFPIAQIGLYILGYSNFIKNLLGIAYYYLPFLLYFFLFLSAYDIINLALKLFPAISALTYEQNVQKIVLGAITGVALLICLLGYIKYRNLSITQYDINIANKIKSAENKPVKIVMASDLHLSYFTPKNFLNEFVETINSLNPDIILLAGDIIDNTTVIPSLIKNKTPERFSELQAKYGVYGILGNHEGYMDLNKSIDFINQCNINLLIDTSIVIDNKIQLIGRKDLQHGKRPSLKTIGINQKMLTIVMDHQPKSFSESKNSNIDLHFSGHTHHGQLFPFNLITKRMYPLSWGYKNTDNTHFIVSCGAQLWGPRVRTAGKSEIVVVNIH